MLLMTPFPRISAEDLAPLTALFERPLPQRPVPRYTSYPTAVQFQTAFGPQEAERILRRAAERANEPLALYVHIPFCAHRCSYCACEVVVARRPQAAETYLGHLEKEIAGTSRWLGGRTGLQVLHLGGGTPTFLSPAQIERLFETLTSRFKLLPEAEVSVELDPRATTAMHVRTLRGAGVNRVSLGVQDFDPGVQEKIGRHQTAEETLNLFHSCREAGFERINLDLVYGLPGQTEGTIGDLVERVASLRPDRIALYGYAHVPWMRKNQSAIPAESLPDPVERLKLFLQAAEGITRAGYDPIGMDHFALPADELAIACRARRLGRNFMGYTPHGSIEMLGLGVSSIGHIGAAYLQNHKKLATYYQRIESGVLPIERGCLCSLDDDVRRSVIHDLLCHLSVDFDSFENRWGMKFESYFRIEMKDLEDLEQRGLIRRIDRRIEATPLGRLFVRNVALVFDRYNRFPLGAAPRLSSSV